MKAWIQRHPLISFFVLTYALTFGVQFGFIVLQPGQPLRPWSLVWAFSVFSPTIMAFVLSWVMGGMARVRQLLGGYTRWKTGFGWYLAAAFIFLFPLAIAWVYSLLGYPVTGLKPGVTIPSLLGQVVFTLFSGPVSEEAGWRGFALPRLQARYSALVSTLILGVIWTCWHLPLFFMTGATQVGIPFPIYLVLVVTIALYLTFLYNSTGGSLIITILAHFAYNLTGTLITGPLSLMPAMTFYMTAGPMLFLLVIGIIILLGPRSLSRKPKLELAA